MPSTHSEPLFSRSEIGILPCAKCGKPMRLSCIEPASPGFDMQVRAVGLGNPTDPRDAGRDKDMETIWCGEFERLQSLVAKAGGNVSIESARPVGQYPLKVIADLATHPADSDAIATRQRTR